MVDGRQQNAGAHRTNLLRSAEIWVDHPLDVTDPDQSDDPFEDHHDRTGNPHFDHPHNDHKDHHRTVRDCDRGPGPRVVTGTGPVGPLCGVVATGAETFARAVVATPGGFQGVNHHLAGGDRHVLPLQRRGIDRRPERPPRDGAPERRSKRGSAGYGMTLAMGPRRFSK